MKGPGSEILLIEDDPVMGGSLVQRLKLEGFSVRWERTASDGLQALRQSKPSAVVSDIRLPDRSGEHLYMDALSLLGRTPIVFVTAFADLQQAIRLVQAGADDYLQKPFSTDRLVERLRHLISRAQKRQDLSTTGDPFSLSQTLANLLPTLKRVSDSDLPVLITGETGVGKEIAARFIYESSQRRGAAFLAVNCAAIPAEFLEAAMFGQEEQQRAPARARHEGYLEEVADGVLLLDEVADMHPQLQASMLRVMQERRFRRVGGMADLEFKGRIIATTNTDLRERVAIGRFREDLYYRLAVVEIEIPPLRTRIAEIRPLAEHFLSDVRRRAGRSLLEFSPEAMDAMHRHEWPGNVRELRNRIERAAAFAEADVLTDLDLFPDHILLDKVRDKPLAEARASAERREIEIAIAQSGGRIGDAAKALGISRTTLWKRMKAMGMSGVDEEGGS